VEINLVDLYGDGWLRSRSIYPYTMNHSLWYSTMLKVTFIAEGIKGIDREHALREQHHYRNYIDRISCLMNTAYETPKQIKVMAIKEIIWGMTT
jgi:hypothetical protein